MRFSRTTFALAGFAWLAAAGPAAADVQLQMHDGQVTLVAKDATLRQILTEWARVGRTKIVNLERVPGGPLTLELRNVSEQEALDVLLRTLSGYMAAPRDLNTPDASLYDRIILIPTSSAPRPTTTPTAQAPFQQPTFQQRPVPSPNDDDRDDDQPSPNVAQPPPQRPVFPTFPQPQVVSPQGGPVTTPGGLMPPPPPQGIPNAVPPGTPQPAPNTTPGSQPSAPFTGARTPGMIVQPPPQPGQTVNPGQQPRGPNDN
jgi:hypothetical protein